MIVNDLDLVSIATIERALFGTGRARRNPYIPRPDHYPHDPREQSYSRHSLLERLMIAESARLGY